MSESNENLAKTDPLVARFISANKELTREESECVVCKNWTQSNTMNNHCGKLVCNFCIGEMYG